MLEGGVETFCPPSNTPRRLATLEEFQGYTNHPFIATGVHPTPEAGPWLPGYCKLPLQVSKYH